MIQGHNKPLSHVLDKIHQNKNHVKHNFLILYESSLNFWTLLLVEFCKIYIIEPY